MRIGVISDTHNFLDPQLPGIFQGVDHILHGGDIGLPRVLMELERIAPVTAVQGNTDDPTFNYRLFENVDLGGMKFLLHHIVNPHALSEPLRARIEKVRPAVLIFGHTHKQFWGEVNGVTFLNPGYAGKSRFGMSRSLAILHVESEKLRAEFIELPGTSHSG
jgi:uncharacterized protein